MNACLLADSGLLARLNRVPVIDFAADLRGALQGGWRTGRIGSIRTQSWGVALTDRRPVLLQLNCGGDLNLAQLAYGSGVLDEAYVEHLRQNGDRL